jgi:hypothetical protein
MFRPVAVTILTLIPSIGEMAVDRPYPCHKAKEDALKVQFHYRAHDMAVLRALSPTAKDCSPFELSHSFLVFGPFSAALPTDPQ